MTERFVSIEDVQTNLRIAIEHLNALDDSPAVGDFKQIGFKTVLEIIGAIEAADTKLTELAVIIDRMRQNWPADLPPSDPSASRSS